MRPRARARSSGPGGYTLIELMVMLAILGIAAAVVIPSAIDQSPFESASGARTIMTDLEYAQNVAITTQTPVTVSFNVGANSYQLTNASGLLKNPMTKADYVVQLAAQSGLNGTKISSVSFNGAASVTFDEMGAPSNAGTVKIQAGASVCQITVAAATGKVSVAVVGS